MKVCYVTHLPNLTGASQSLLDILSTIREYDVEPTVLLGKKGPIEQELIKMDIPYAVIPYSSEISEKNMLINLYKKLKNMVAVKKIGKWFVEEQFDLIHNNSFLVSVGMEAAFRVRIPYICHNRDFVWEDHRIRLLTENRQNFLLEHSDAAIEISEAVYRKYKKVVPNAKYHVLCDGIAIEKYYQKHDQILLGDTVELLLAGRIAPGKGQLEAIKAIECLEKRDLTRYHLTIIGSVGDAEYDKEIREYVSARGIKHVSFLGFSNLRDLRARSDIALVCSKAEALGRVTIESMLAGCLVIGAKAGATEDLIKDGITGLFYKAGSPEDLADKIVYASNNPVIMNNIAKRGQERAKLEFEIRSYNMKLAQLYKELST